VGPGNIDLVEDGTGKGHITRVIGDQDRVTLFHSPINGVSDICGAAGPEAQQPKRRSVLRIVSRLAKLPFACRPAPLATAFSWLR
jgi:hypothetical protein